MQRFPTGKYISINFVLWGITLAATGSATNFATLATGRFFLGVFESCLNPGFVLITSSWWKREEQSSRVALWYCANGLFGAPSGFVNYLFFLITTNGLSSAIFFGIAHIHVAKMFPYQWMFIIVSILSM